jgi:TPR repeat protein
MTDQTTPDFKAMDIEQLLPIAEATNDPEAQFVLSEKYFDNDDIQTSLKWSWKAALQGHLDACFNLALHYQDRGDYGTMVDFLSNAAKNGHGPSQHQLAYAIEKGLGIEDNAEAAVYWLRLAVMQGFAESQNSLANCYRTGYGVEQSDAEAIKWYRKAAEQGFEPALEALSKMAEAARKGSKSKLLAQALGIPPKTKVAPAAIA